MISANGNGNIGISILVEIKIFYSNGGVRRRNRAFFTGLLIVLPLLLNLRETDSIHKRKGLGRLNSVIRRELVFQQFFFEGRFERVGEGDDEGPGVRLAVPEIVK